MSFGSFVSGFVPMLMLGSFKFQLNVAVFQEMRRSTQYKWASQERFGQLAARQFVAPGDDTITLPGVIYPSWRGSGAAMENLRTLAARGQPLLLIDAQGSIYGRWVITGVEETRSVFAAFAQPRKIEFSVTLERFDGGGSNLLDTFLANAITAALS